MTIAQLSNIEDFLAELRDESAYVANNIVRWELSRNAKQDAEVDFEVTVWATAIIQKEHPYLLEFGGTAGDDEEGEHNRGSIVAEHWKKQLAEVCKECGLKLRPGKIEVF